jgi:hypothetical protein
MDDKVADWQKLLDGRKYNDTLDPPYNNSVNLNIDMYNGNQWKNVESNGMPTPVFNIIKRAITFFVASITSSKTSIKLEPLEYSEDETQQSEQMQTQQKASDIATAEIANLLEKFKFENRIRDALFKAAQMGDVYSHFYFDMNKKPYRGMLGEVKGEICHELVNGTNVYLGNPNNPIINTDTQPYIVVSGRDMVKRLKREAKQYKKYKSEEDQVTTDANTQYEAGEMAQYEIDSDENGKALYIIVYIYDPDKDTITATKCTENAYMYKDVDLELDYYPVAGLCWEKQENQSHGRALCTDIIPNQIYINRQFAMVMYHLMNAAFPKRVYNADKIAGITNMIAGSIGVKGVMPGESIMNYVGQLEPGAMSGEIIKVIEMAIQYTKEMLGINDTSLGDVNPEQASGIAIASTVRQASIPMENPRSNLYEYIEDCGRILVDMMGTNYGQRPIIVSDKGSRRLEMFDFSTLKNLWLNVKCDVGPSSYWSEVSQVEMLNNLLSRNDPLFTLIDFLESLPKDYQNKDLIERVKENLEKMVQQQQQIAEQEAQMGAQQEQMQGEEQDAQIQQQEAQFEKMAQWLEQQDPELQQKIMALPEGGKEQTIMKLMQEEIKQTAQPMKGGGM